MAGNTTTLRAVRSDRNEMINASKFSAKTGGPARPISGGSAKTVKYWAISMNINNSEEQRETASHPAVISTRRPLKPQDFCGERGGARCKFPGRTAKTAAMAARYFVPKQCSGPGKRRASG
jgi:hypothetical protein